MSSDTVLRIYLARHGQTDWNAELRLQGWTDIPLNATGKQQAMDLQRRLRGVPLDSIYCSALQRSRETAEAVSGSTIPVVSLAELNEQSLGSYEGTIPDGAGLETFRKRRLDFDDDLDGGESRNQHMARIQRALQIIRDRHPSGGSVLIVGHGGTNNLVLQAVMGQIEDLTFRFANTDIYLIEILPNDPPLLWKFLSTNR